MPSALIVTNGVFSRVCVRAAIIKLLQMNINPGDEDPELAVGANHSHG